MADQQRGAPPRVVKLTFAEDFLLSGVAAVTSKTLSAPIERVKMVMQSQGEMVKQGRMERPFGGVADCFRWIMKNEGAAAFWRSNTVNCIRYFPTQALNFAFKNQVKAIDALKPRARDAYSTTLAKNVAAGGIAGAGSQVFVYSLDYARTRLANDVKGKGGERQFTGILDVYRKTLQSDGVAGLYRGFVISAVGIFVYRGLYFGLYDSIVPSIPKTRNKSVDAAARFAIGYLVTVTASLASYPIDTIRRRMMMTSGTGVQYAGSLDAARRIVAADGPAALFRGAGVNILRSVAGAGVLAGFDIVQDVYTKRVYGPECVSAGLSGGGG